MGFEETEEIGAAERRDKLAVCGGLEEGVWNHLSAAILAAPCPTPVSPISPTRVADQHRAQISRPHARRTAPRRIAPPPRRLAPAIAEIAVRARPAPAGAGVGVAGG
jgi:hypothetical protein